MPDAQDRPSLAERLDALFDAIRPEGRNGRRYTNAEVAAAVKQDSPSVRVSDAYLSALRKGTKRNPSGELLAALARFFGVTTSYFLDDATAARTRAQITLLKVAANRGVRRLAFRALELSAEDLDAVTQIVEQKLHGGRSAMGKGDSS